MKGGKILLGYSRGHVANRFLSHHLITPFSSDTQGDLLSIFMMRNTYVVAVRCVVRSV